MRMLYHMWLSPQSRKVRIVLGEKGLDCRLKSEKTWERREPFLKMNPAGEVPVLVEEDGAIYADSRAIAEYLDETYLDPPLIGTDPGLRAEVRRICQWFDDKFMAEVTALLSAEKIMKRFLGMGQPDSEPIRCALQNLKVHMGYISHLAERENYLAGEVFSLADITAASHISVVDYLNDVAWDDFPAAKDWYMRVKSRKSFRPILADRIAGLPPPKHYEKLDF